MAVVTTVLLISTVFGPTAVLPVFTPVEINAIFTTGVSDQTIENLRNAVKEETREATELYIQYSEI